jgi:hypothetical protein
MKLPHTVRAGIGAFGSHLPPLRLPDLDGVKEASDRVPAQLFSAAIKGVELGVAGYAALVRVGVQATDVARRTVAAGSALVSGPPAHTPAAPVQDPWSGGPLLPVDDIRDAVSLSDADAAEVDALPGGETLSHDDLPLADYDHLNIGELRARIRRLGVAELMQLREYEHAHADRLTVVKAFDTRLATLAKQSAAQVPVPAP